MATTVTTFTIDPTLPTRAVPFVSLRNLLTDVAPLMPIRYTDAMKLVIEQGVVRSSQGELLKKSAFYHYWTALRMLGFVDQSLTMPRYDLSGRGRRLIEIGNRTTTSLNREEETLFRSGMLANQQIWDNFLVLFTGDRHPSQQPAIGNRVVFMPVPPKGCKLQSDHFSDPIILDHRLTLAIILGLRRWGQQCGLLDEIFPPTTSKDYPPGTSFMYLIDSKKDMSFSTSNFTEVLHRHQQHSHSLYGSVMQFNIPTLLTYICVQEGLRLATIQRIFAKWLEENAQYAAVERPSRGLIEEQRGHRNTRRLDASQPWFIRNNAVYTTLFVKANIFNQER